MSRDTRGTAEQEVMEVSAPILAGDPEVDIQVATAKRYPRSITSFLQRAQQMATLTPEIAASCIYALPRDGKNIEGPSARFAELIANAWGNLRAEGKTIGDDGQYVTGRGTSWDVESNVAIAFEVRRRITNRKGETFNADMIMVTGNAASSIALRNAILKNVPSPFWKPIYNACRKVIAGDAQTFAVRRDGLLKEFAVMGVTEERLCAAFGLKGKADITFEHMVTLTGFATALREGDTTIEETFPENGPTGPQPAQRKSQAAPAATQTATSTAAATPSPTTAPTSSVVPFPTTAAAPAYIGVIVDVLTRQNGTLIKLSTGYQCATRDAELVRSAETLKAQQARVELTCTAPRDPKFAPILTEISVLPELTA